MIANLDDLPWDNRFTRELPADPEESGRRRQVQHAAFSRVPPTPAPAPATIAWSPEVAELLGLDPELPTTQDFADVFGGSRVPEGADPFAMAYAGHQFGNFAGQLGDGRAIALGEVLDVHGGHQTLQLKGAGATPYSRSGDGRAVLRSSIREFLCSEAMHHLGIPTTRALSLVATGDKVVRDVLYDGNPAPEPGAVVCRVAPSFVRFGNFELPASRGDHDLLRALVDFTIRNDFPGRTIDEWFAEVCDRTADLVVDWMRVGFVHGVLNTDNLSILGLTIDYGPYGWLESFDPGWTPNTTDAGTRRYRYGAQPQIAHWNLLQLANALATIVDDHAGLQAGLDGYARRYADRFRTMMCARLGWGEPDDGDDERIDALFKALVTTEVDQVLFFRDLPTGDVSAAYYDDAPDTSAVDAWLQTWRDRAGEVDRTAMDARNPRYVLRNYLAQEAIDAAEAGDNGLVLELLDVLRHPYDEQPGRERFAQKRPEWARHRVGCSMLSCSS